MKERTHREELMDYISDAHKDAYGFRPRGYNYPEMTDAELEAEAASLSEAVNREITRERVEEAKCREAWEASVSDTIKLGAADRETAVRWLLDAEGLLEECSEGYANYTLGVGYDYDLTSFEVTKSYLSL